MNTDKNKLIVPDRTASLEAGCSVTVLFVRTLAVLSITESKAY